jgi:amino acid adenylation domain-containing protein
MINTMLQKIAMDYWLEKTGSFEPSEIGATEGSGLYRPMHSRRFLLDDTTVAAIKKICNDKDAGVYLYFLAALHILVYQYTSAESTLVACAAPWPAEPALPGDMPPLFLGTTIDPDADTRQLLLSLQETLKEAFRHREYSFEKFKEKYEPLNGPVGALFNYSLAYLPFTGKNESTEPSKLAFTLQKTAASVEMEIVHAGNYAGWFIERLGQQYMRILSVIAQHPREKISAIPILTAPEKRQLLETFNDTAVDFPESGLSIIELFERQARAMPEQVAVQSGGNSVSYHLLRLQTLQLAALLREKGIGRNGIVALMCERSEYMVLGMLGSLKAGAAYVPIDPDLPGERVDFILRDSAARAVLTTSCFYASRPELFTGYEVLLMDEMSGELETAEIGARACCVNAPGDPAYIIYTSGSTGRPKGIVILHKGFLNNVLAFKSRYASGFSVADRCLAVANMAFDASVPEIYMPLTSGSTLVILDKDRLFDPAKLADFIVEQAITLAYVPPVLLKDVLRCLQPYGAAIKINKMFVGVESIKDTVLYDYCALIKGVDILNGYGPTETTVICSALSYIPQTPLGENVSIGKPIANYRIYIVNNSLELLPVGVAGEVCVSGPGVAQGYLNNEELTALKFIDDPFSEGKKMFRTGDLAKWTPEGEIIFIGRKDNQVKVRGYRVELGEIESVLMNYPSIKDAVVCAVDDGAGSNYLYAWLVHSAPASDLTFAGIRAYLSRLLPGYMIPSGFMILESIPVTSNGKTDRKKLPRPESNVRVMDEKDRPSTELEKQLAAIWKEVLNIPEAGVNDNFFESGGHSLKAARLIAIVLRELGAEVPLRQVFVCGSIKKLAAYIEAVATSDQFEIPVAPVAASYPVSFAQRRLYLSYLLNTAVTNYNMPMAYAVRGPLEIDRVEKAFSAIIAKHHSLRTGFSVIDGVLVQQVAECPDFKILLVQEDGKFIRPFDLSRPPLIRVGIIQRAEGAFVLLVDMHHIVSDGISIDLLLKEFARAYYTGTLPPLSLQYKDYACWLSQYRETPAFELQRKYWLTNFAGKQEPVELPLDFPRPDENTFEGDCVFITVDKATVSGLRQVAIDNNSTLFLVSFAAYYVLLYKYSGQEDIVVGIPVAGRIHPALNDIIGMFVNTLPIRSTLQPGQPFTVWLNQLMDNFFRAMDNQLYPFEELIEALNLERTGTRNPLFDTLFAYQNMEMEVLQIRGLSVQPVVVNTTTAKFDLSVEIVESGEEWQVAFNFSTDLFKKQTIERMARHYLTILSGVLQSPGSAIGDIGLLSEEEREQLPGCNDSFKARAHQTIHQLFEAQAAAVPDAIAVFCNDNALTYEALNKRANALASFWVNNGLKKGEVVAVLGERNEQLIIGLLAILKAGAVFLPIDPAYPPERIAFILEDAHCTHVWKSGDIPEPVAALAAERGLEVLATGPETSILLPEVSGQDNAYIIYTSGSTGRPKGVIIQHAAIVNYISWAAEYYWKGQPGAMPLFTSISFDLTLTAIFAVLATGNEIVIYNGKEEGLLIEKIVTDNRVDIVKLTPAHLRLLNTTDTAAAGSPAGLLQNSRIRTLIVGGEALESRLAEDIYHKSGGRIEIYNEYGPTEATVGCMIYTFDPGESLPTVPIGKPIDNTRIYLLDRDGRLCPEGITGEIGVAGEGLARGYLDRPDLTDEKFVWIAGLPGGRTGQVGPEGRTERVYRTGDLGRWLPDGNMVFAGRKDEQLKINGYRIEPGEIESVLLLYSDIKEAVIAPFEGKGGGRALVAYFTSSATIDIPALRAFLASRVPSYMAPAWFVQVEAFALTSNGKINRKALPKPAAALSAAVLVPPGTEMEKQLLAIWNAVLESDSPGITDNFFESGGHSLKALVLVSRIQKAFHVEVSLRDVFSYPTVKTLAHHLSTASGLHFVPITRIARQAHYPLSSAQKRIFVMSHFEGAETTYNIYHAFWVDGRLDLVKLKNAFRSLINRHESLRTSFHIIDDEPVQIVHDTIPFELVEIPYDADTDAVVGRFIRKFDIAIAPLFRVGVMKLSAERHLMLLDMHHIISDGGSLTLFSRELWELYKDNALPELTIQYKDYAAWQQSLFNSGAIDRQKQYWKQQFEGELPLLDLPLDFPRPLNQTFEGRNYYFKPDARTVPGIFNFVIERKVTLNMFMLAVYNILLSKYTSHEDIIIGTPGAGRTHADLEPVIGMFVNTLALRNYPTGEKTFEQLLDEVKTTTLTAYENQDYPFEELIQLLNLKRDTSRNPLFDTMFLLVNHRDEQKVQGLGFTDYPIKVNVAKLDLVFETVQLPDTIEFMVNYNTALFTLESIQRLGRHFTHIVSQVIGNPAIRLEQIVLPDEEEARELQRFALGRGGSAIAGEAAQQTITGLWAAQVEQHKTRIALVSSQDQLTVEELDQRSSAWAAYMKEVYAVKTGDKVAVLLQRGVELPVALLAILKTGAAYIPIDPIFPARRIEYILDNSGCSLVITDKAFECRLPVFNIHGATPCPAEGLLPQAGGRLPDAGGRLPQAEDLAYMTYTSGSTGMPKGVMISHGNVVVFTQNLDTVFGITPGDTILALTNITFDISVLEILCSLVAGVTVVLADDREVNDFDKIGEIIHREKINVLQLTPSRLSLLLQRIGSGFLSGIRVLLVGGEAMPAALFHSLKAFTQTRVFNVYGPTETCIWSAADEIKDDTLAIGKPLLGEQIFILGTNDRLQPVNIPGEICIAGTGVGKGYYGNEELTAEKFFHNEGLSPGRIYRTGDIGRWLPDGRIEYISRADNQVKVRGYRIELGEIENALSRYEDVAIAAAVVTGNNSEKQLIAFYESDTSYGDGEIRSFLANFLPAYMLPVRCIHLRTLPLTSSGKIDRKALETIARQHSASLSSLTVPAGEEPTGAIQKSLVAIWKEILNTDHISISDNIFERGADSIKLIQVLNRIKKDLGIDLPLTTAFTYTSIRELAEYIRNMEDQVKPEEELPYSLIHPGKEQIIFCFPPFMGYSFIYTALANYLPDYTLCCFHFQEKGEYLRLMMDMQQGAPFILMGYSFGGNFAFEVAKELEASGQEVSDIILIDSYKRWEAEEKTDEELESTVADLVKVVDMSVFGENAAYLEILKEKTFSKMLRYSKYMNGKIDKGRVNARIHLVRCEDSPGEATETAIINRNWEASTNNQFVVYQGKGAHADMLDKGYLTYNAQFLRAILQPEKMEALA